VMNLVALLIAPAVVSLKVGEDANTTVRVLIALVALAIVVAAVVVSKRRSVVVGGAPSTSADTALTTSAP